MRKIRNQRKTKNNIADYKQRRKTTGQRLLSGCFVKSRLFRRRQKQENRPPSNEKWSFLKAVREAVGPMFPISFRFSAEELVEGGNTLEDSLEMLEYLQEDADILNVSAALNDSLQYQIDANYLEDGWRSYMAKAVKEKYPEKLKTLKIPKGLSLWRGAAQANRPVNGSKRKAQ